MFRALQQLLIRYLLLVVCVVLVNFFLPRLLPGNPLDFSSGEGLDAAAPLTSEARANLSAYYHVDEPLLTQFSMYLDDLGSGDLGTSISRPMPVANLIRDRLPWTLALLMFSLFVSAGVGTAAGMVAGWIPGAKRDRWLISASALFAAVPEFLIAIILLLGGAVWLGWFPLFGGETAFASYSGGINGSVDRLLDIVWHLTLPAITLVLAGTSAFMLVSRDATAGVQHASWLTAARGKGLSEPYIAVRHALPVLAPPLLTYFGLRLGGVLSGALVVERVFNVPGLGLLGFEAIGSRDYPVLQALFLLSGLGVLAATLMIEICYLYLNAARRMQRG